MNPLRARASTQAELEAFERTCERLAGFDPALSFERVDGQLCALAAGPSLPPAAEWLPALFDDTFERTFADPADRAQALGVLQTRLAVLCSQLNPEALFEDPDGLRLDPLMAEWTAEQRQALVDEGAVSVEDAALMQTGTLWAAGFTDAVEALPLLWSPPADEEAEAAFAQGLAFVGALLMPTGSDELKDHIAAHYPKGEPSRDDLIADACMAVQDMRMYWVDFAPRPATRRVEPTPGRNDPCPCGSGKKYKKCHGAAAQA